MSRQPRLALLGVFVFLGHTSMSLANQGQIARESQPKCYDTPLDLMQIYPQPNNSFGIKVNEECVQLMSADMFLYVFDISIVPHIHEHEHELDKWEQDKRDRIKVNRSPFIYSLAQSKHLNVDSKFMFGIQFISDSGPSELVLYPQKFTFMSTQSSLTELVLLIVLGILLVVTLILLALLVYINYFGNGVLQNYLIFWTNDDDHKRICNRANEEETYPSIEQKSRVIAVHDLLSVVPSLLESDALKTEYNSIPKSQLYSWNLSRYPQNRAKNRYGNLLPYDHSRVILDKESQNATDYFNANFIEGYKRNNRYIATQGPIDNTIADFWRCIWQFQCHQIVMLTNLEESGKAKCEKYWPDLSQYYGAIKVTLQKTELFADYTIRVMLVEKDGQQLDLVQYHFCSWPDHAVPLYACTLISFINRIRSSPFYKTESAILVHCSAGIGRTGALILIDTMLEMARKEGKIDILAHFCKMRRQRFNMVEKMSQYLFVYQVLFEALSHEPTNIACTEFKAYLDKMTKGSEKHCLLYKQFEILNSISLKKIAPDVCKFGLSNPRLNRLADVMPPDYARVILPNLSDYINAVYVNGYRKQDAYIVTQIPYEPNRPQMWKMIQDGNINCILLLCDANNDNLIYWPKMVGQKLDFGDGSVTLTKEEMSNALILRTFSLKPSESIVRQIHLRYSPSHANGQVLTSMFIELKEKLDQLTSSAGNYGSLVVQCLDGVHLSGLFCSADFIFERIKEEQQIDVFLAVQKIRANRPQFIINFKQYLHLHQMAIEYLNSFEQYANFK